MVREGRVEELVGDLAGLLERYGHEEVLSAEVYVGIAGSATVDVTREEFGELMERRKKKGEG
jgi:hypothetical protein